MIKAQSQLTLIDLTDAYSVIMTNESHTWLGDTSAVNGTQSTTTQIMALCGSDQVACTVGDIICPTGIAAVSDGKTPSPIITITATSAVKAAGTITIPVMVADGEITINKVFSYSIAFTGQTGATGATGAAGVGISGITYHYMASASSSGVTTTTNGWTTTLQTTTTTKKYLWSYQEISYTDGSQTTTTPCIIGTHGATGATGNTGETGVGVSDVKYYYLASASGSGVTTSTTGWTSTVQTTTTAKRYLWSYQEISYTDGSQTTTTPCIIGTHGATGADGADAITLVITSSAGIIFKNTAIATTLTAHIYQGGAEVTGTALAALGTINWYKDSGTTAVATGQTLTISAGDVTNSANYTAQLEV